MECFVFVVLSVEGVYQQNQSVSFVNVFRFDRMKVTIECMVLCALLTVEEGFIPITFQSNWLSRVLGSIPTYSNRLQSAANPIIWNVHWIAIFLLFRLIWPTAFRHNRQPAAHLFIHKRCRLCIFLNFIYFTIRIPTEMPLWVLLNWLNWYVFPFNISLISFWVEILRTACLFFEKQQYFVVYVSLNWDSYRISTDLLERD